jgi:hypothetical protein
MVVVAASADSRGSGSESPGGVQGGERRGAGQAEAAMPWIGAHRFEDGDPVVLIQPEETERHGRAVRCLDEPIQLRRRCMKYGPVVCSR